MLSHHHKPECHAKTFIAIFKVRVTVVAHVIKIYVCFYCIFLTFDPFATKFSLMLHPCKSECLVKSFDYRVQGKSLSKGLHFPF